jgi:outer membrane receptor protein involved in Fe transport
MFSLDVTVFYLDWEDIQLLAVVNNFGINANGGTAVSKGLEFTAAVYPTDGLSLSFNGAYTDAYLTQDTDPIVGGADGDPLSFVPEWSFGLNGDYEWTLMGDSTAYAGGTVGYTGDRPADFNNRAANGSNRELESYVTLNLRAGIDTGRWTFEVYGKNLADERGVTTINDVGALPNGAVGLGIIRPRTFGMTVGVSF